jgi:hypothetical protein
MYSFITGYGMQVGSVGAFVYGGSFLLGLIDEVTNFFRDNRHAMIIVMAIHFGLYALRYKVDGEARATRELV